MILRFKIHTNFNPIYVFSDFAASNEMKNIQFNDKSPYLLQISKPLSIRAIKHKDLTFKSDPKNVF